MSVMLLFLVMVVHIYADCPNNCTDYWQQGTCMNMQDGTSLCACVGDEDGSIYTGDDCSIPHDNKFDWDNIECQNGGRFYPPLYASGWVRYCVCPYGYAGMDCSVCATDLGCAQYNTPNATYKCDNSVYPMAKKYYNCSMQESSLATLLHDQGSATGWCEFPNNLATGGACSISFYLRKTGVPLLFFCNFTDCATSVDEVGNNNIVCQQSHCNGTTFQSLVTQIAEVAQTTMTFSCTPQGACLWSQEEIKEYIEFIHLQCGAGECVAHPIDNIVLPPSTYSRLFLVIGVGCGVLLFSILLSIAAYVVLRGRNVYRPLPHIEATLSFHNISCSIKLKNGSDRVLLHNVSGTLYSGHVTAIMGASGAGKTTFLDVLAGRKNTGTVAGDICINGEPRRRNFKRLTGYVTQDDVFMGTLTVREHLRYTALLRLPAHMPMDVKMKRVDDCMNELGISHIAESRIGTSTARGISGGERKRLAIAAELVVDPAILLLDEPTSGLDSYSASALIQTLHALAHGRKNRTIVMSIHQPRSDIFHMFDSLMVFSNGRVVYHGEGSAAVSYFASIGYECPPSFNPADFIIDTVSSPQFQLTTVSNIQLNSVNLRKVRSGADVDMDDVDEYAASFFTQFGVLTHRTMMHSLRNPFLLRVQFCLYVLVAVLLGMLYHPLSFDLLHGGFQNRMGSLFFIITLLSFGSLTSIDLFFSERLLFLRERATGCYRTSAYFLAKAISDLVPMRIIPPLVLGSIVYYWIGFQPLTYKFVIFLVTLVAVSITSTSLCFIISSLTPSVAVGNLLAILLLFFFLIFGGFLVNISNMPDSIRWITNLSYMTFGYAILMVNEFNGISILINPSGLDTHTLVEGAILLEQVGMSIDYLHRYILGLGVMMGVYFVAGYLALRFAVKERR